MDTRVIAHRFTIGTVLADAFRVFVRQFPRLLLVAIVVVPMGLVGPALFDIDMQSPLYLPLIAPLLSDITSTTATLIAEASIVMVVLHHLRGLPVSSRYLVAWLPAIGTVILGGLLVWLPDFLGRAGYYFLAEQFPDSQWIVALPYCTGLAVYILVLTFWCAFVPVVVAERCGFHAALTRSAQLARGQRWRILALMLILLIMSLAVGYSLSLVIYLDGGAASSLLDDLPSTLTYYGGYQLYTLFSSVVSAVVFHHLRLREEGMDSERAVTAFD